MTFHLSPDDAQVWSQTVVEALQTPFPWQSQHMSSSERDCDVTPWRLHPTFHGSLDWHSSCHMQLSALLLLESFDHGLSGDIKQQLVQEVMQRLRPENLAVERQYLADRPYYERPYGWGWIVKLAAEAQASSLADRLAVGELMAITDVIAEHLAAWLPKLMYPVRTGQHDNTAFGLLLLREGFEALSRTDVVQLIDQHARRLFAKDVAYPAHYEPSGNDFLSAALSEAELMQHVMDDGEFSRWLPAFLPELGHRGDKLCEPLQVSDVSDGKLVHLFGLELSRAASLRALRPHVDAAAQVRIDDVIPAQIERARTQIADGHFMSTHWLVTFALRAFGIR